MQTKALIGGTFAAVAAIVAASSFISCSSDDEYYENGNYTLANKRMTRSTETYTPLPSDTTYTNYNFVFKPVHPYVDNGTLLPSELSANVDVMIYRINGVPQAKMMSCGGNPDLIVNGVSFELDSPFSGRYILCADGTYSCTSEYGIEYYSYKGVVPNTVFR